MNSSASSRSAAFIATLAMLLAVGACSDGVTTTPPAFTPMRVQVFRVSQQAISTPTELYGQIVASEPAWVYPQVDGLRVERVFVEAGTRVHAGQALVQLDSRMLRSELAQAEQAKLRTQASTASARAQQALAEARLAQAEDEARRYAAVVALGAVSEQDLSARQSTVRQNARERDAALQAVRAAEAEAASAMSALRLASERQRDATLRAPMAGTVSERAVEVGAVTSASGAPLFKLAGDDDREFEAVLGAEQLARIAIGDRAEVFAGGTLQSTGQGLAARVRSIDRALAGDARRGRLRIALDGTEKPPLGASATARLTGRPAAGMRIPTSAVQFDPHPWVFVVDAERRVQKRRVALAPEGDVVTSGLAEGDTIVRSAAALLSEGQRIESVVVSAAPLAPKPVVIPAPRQAEGATR